MVQPVAVVRLVTELVVRPVTELVEVHQPSKCTILPNRTNRPILRNAGEQCPSERAVRKGVLPPILPKGVAGGTHPSTAP